MTSVYMNIGDTEMELLVEGHAGYNDRNDIVCAAVSILGQAAAVTIIDMQWEYQVNVTAQMVPGKLSLHAQYETKIKKEMESRIEIAKNGFLMLETAYPDHVKCHFLAVQTKNREL